MLEAMWALFISTCEFPPSGCVFWCGNKLKSKPQEGLKVGWGLFGDSAVVEGKVSSAMKVCPAGHLPKLNAGILFGRKSFVDTVAVGKLQS